MELTANNIKNVCRICLTEPKLCISLFSTYFPGSGVLVSGFLQQITNLELSESDDLSKILCPTCFETLSDVFRLIQLCISSNSVLRSALDVINKPTKPLCPSDDAEPIASSKREETESESNDCLFDNAETKENNSPTKTVDKYCCGKCKVTFNNKSKLLKHEKTHNEVNLFKCDECLQTFSKKLHLNVHLRSHIKNEDKQFTCSTCNRQFIYEYLLKQHEFKHTDQKPFPCSKCSKGCLTAESLKRHMKVHDQNYIRKKHQCQICSKEFAYPSFLAEHMKNHTGEKPHLCSICGKGFRQSGALHYHQRVHSGYKPFMCDVCNGTFMSQSVLKVHMRKHTNERPYVCHICGMAFRQSTDLKSHQRTHSGDKPVLCTICGKRMSTTGQLTIHIRSHTGEKPFVCQRCSKAFATKTMLVKHERIHTGERPYVCDICGRAFNQSSTLKTHKNTHQANKKRKWSDRRKTKYTLTGSVDKEVDECLLYRHHIENIETEIVTDQFMGDSVEEISVVKSSDHDENVKAHFTVILPAPIPLLHNL